MGKFFEMFGFEPNESREERERRKAMEDALKKLDEMGAEHSVPHFSDSLTPIAVWYESRLVEEDNLMHHFCVVANNIQNNRFVLYAGGTVENEGNKIIAPPLTLEGFENKNHALQTWEQNIVKVRYTDKLPGERRKEVQFTCASMGELSQELSRNGIHDEFMSCFPQTSFENVREPIQVTDEVAKEIGLPTRREDKKKKERDELVKKYGEDNIKKLEDKIRERHEKRV